MLCIRTYGSCLQDEMPPFPAPSLLSAEQATSPTVSTITSSNNSMSIAPPPKPARQEPQQQPKSAASGNRSESPHFDIVFVF
jgi:hypothetical protein